MREVVASAATLAGLVGLACLYNQGSTGSRARSARDADVAALGSFEDSLGLDVMEDLNDEAEQVEADYMWMKELGWIDNPSDAPEIFKEDLEMFQGKQARKSVQFIVKCLKNDHCKQRAIQTYYTWGNNYRKFMEANMDTYMKPVVTDVVADPDNSNGMGACTPQDTGLWPCTDAVAASAATYAENQDPFSHLSDVEKINTLLAGDSSQALKDLNNHIQFNSVDAEANVFTDGTGGAKFILIIPNGVPISMADDYNETYRNYWDWFKHLNTNYIGIEKKKVYKGRSNYSFWFIRQDEKPKAIMKTTTKATKRFPWNRFEQLMSKPQSTAIQPKFKTTFQLILSEASKVTAKISADPSRGNDCFVFWFHQYLPQDIAELADPNVQQLFVSNLESKCTIFHFWVGFKDTNSQLVVNYLQGIIQPTQATDTSEDHDLRGYWNLADLNSLDTTTMSSAGSLLAKRVYNVMAAERLRSRCLLKAQAINIADKLASFTYDLAKENEYYYATSTFSTSAYAFTTEQEATTVATTTVGTTYGATTWNTTTWSTTGQADLPTDEACCGIGLSGDVYNIYAVQCCKNGFQDVNDYCA